VENVCAVMAAYLDDLAVGSDSAAEHLVDLEAVLERTRGAGLKLKLAKCLFGKRSVELLVHRVSHGLVRPSDDHTAVFANFKEPRNASELLRFIGLVILFGEHVESAADRLAPLYEVLVGTGWNRKKRKKQKVVVADWAERWKEPQVRAFETLREILAHPDFLVAPRPLAQKNLVTDASMYVLGAVILQWEGEAVGWLQVAFASRKQKGAEARYTVTEKEYLAVLFGLQKFRQHLYGERFGVVTDHSALVWLMSLRGPKHRLARWILEFQSFDFEVEHAPGNESIMVIPDALSRDTMDKDLTLCARCLETVGSVE
jgi:RNase H-like domain found in reverse transcriptase